MLPLSSDVWRSDHTEYSPSLMKLPSLSPFVCMKKKKTGSHLFPVFGSVHCSCVSICVKPPVPVSPRPDVSFLQIKRWLPASWQPSNCNSLPSIFSQCKPIRRCAPLYKTPLSLSPSRSLSSCIRGIHPSLSHSASLSFSITVAVFPTVWLASDECAGVLCWSLSPMSSC